MEPLRDYQIDGRNALVANKKFILADEMGLGKAQPVDCQILTPTGWREMGTIRADELVIGSSGAPIKVLAVYPQGVKRTYLVTTTSGRKTRCSIEHLWEVKDQDRGGKPKILTLQEILNLGLKRKVSGNRFSLPNLHPIPFGEIRLPVDPYILGIILGDGYISSKPVAICNADQEVVDEVARRAPEGVRLVYVNRVRWDLRVGKRGNTYNPIRRGLTDLGLMGKRSWEKEIPSRYLFASGEQRLELVQGLMDSDGYCDPKGSTLYYSTSKRLAQGLSNLVRSLGGLSKLRERPKPTENGRPIYQVSVTLPEGLNPFKLRRKAELYRNTRVTDSIVEILQVEDSECVCISIDSPDGLYVTDDFILTHNTRQALEAMVVVTDHAFPRILVVCPKVAVFVWQDEMEKWFPGLAASEVRILLGAPEKRTKVLEDLKPPYILITTYDILKRDFELLPQYYNLIITDEAHRYRNRKTATFKAVKKLGSDFLFQLTGTPASRGPQDVWTMLNLIDPKRFGSYWRFVNTYCDIYEGPFGKEILGPKNVEALRMLLKRYLLRRKKKDVIKDLPEKIRQKLTIEMTAKQRKLYDKFEKDMIAGLPDGGILVTPNSLGKFVRLRQMLIWPHLLYEAEDPNKLDQGAGFSAILEHIEDSGDEHVVIFTPFAKALDGFESALIAKGYNADSIIQLRGGLHPDEVRDRIARFEEAQGIALCTIKFAQSFSLSTSSTAYFLGYEFNPDENHQAEDRLHRLTSKSVVNIYYVCHKDSIDEHILDILNNKNRSVSSFLKAPDGSLQVLGG